MLRLGIKSRKTENQFFCCKLAKQTFLREPCSLQTIGPKGKPQIGPQKSLYLIYGLHEQLSQ
ncbi:hypothetical protein SGRA_0018 [Saprospira grandis str. Lewin]|uniref:Uncharacterized protein n=1 Tax=Saprospira grandis (strain Lewin) TaxID=984262 RepID=H6L3S8_SAPGL|nr:hypothetical protein SGRA_0018 [Saprospira grandis str. Lewin]